MNPDDMARVRLVSPTPGRTDRVCDVEVSSDRGATWAPLAVNRIVTDSSVDDLTTITATIVATPGVVDLEILERGS